MKTSDTPNKRNLPARERILLTANDLFYREGIRATGIDRVIAESGVAKATFYRHFASKNDLVREYLEYRHHRWMDWFKDALPRHGNGVGELGCVMPEVLEITQRHKREMTSVIATLLAPSRQRANDAQAVALAIDGAIIRAQCDPTPDAALLALNRLLKALIPLRQQD
ncbi:MAG: TetR/AcrR family transcriptional regulator [Acidiferrobacteraceae bacterium]